MPTDNAISSKIDDLKRALEITKDVRFQSALRLTARQRMSSYIVSLLSLYVIGLSMIPNILEITPHQNQLLLSSSIILSVFIIFTSLIDGSQNFHHQAELLHQCARKIATIHHQVKMLDTNKQHNDIQAELTRLQSDYAKALDECHVNHSNADYYWELSRKEHLFPHKYNQTPPFIKIFKKIYYRSVAAILTWSWLALHAIAGLGVTFVIYKYIFNAT